MAIDLNPTERMLLLSLLQRHLPHTTVWAYGSRVKWNARPQSDLDLVVFAGRDQRADVLDLKEALEESSLPFPVAVLVWDELPESFRKHVVPEYVVLQRGADEQSAAASEWPTATIDDIAEKVAMGPFGSSIKVETFVSEGIPIISGQHLHGSRVDDGPGFNFISPEHAQRLANANVMRGDVVFTHAGNIGQVAYIPENSRYQRYIISQRQFYMRCDHSKAVPEFVVMYFKSPEGQHQLLANTSQVGVPAIAQPVTYLRTIVIPLPPLPEQRAIAHVLGTLDDKIELNRRMNETLEAMARALFQDWFVDFGPIRAKLAGHPPYLPPELWALFPDRLVDSELGEIPAGWELRALDQCASLNPESWSRTNTPEAVEYVDLANTKWGVIEVIQQFPWKDAPSRARRILRMGDTIVGTVRPGNGSYALIGNDGLTGSTGFAVLRPIQSRHREYVYLAATAPGNIERLAHRADGAAYPAVRPDVVGATEAVVPDDEILDHFSELAAPTLDRIEANKAESRCLAALRDTLLPKLVSGEMRVERAS